jgi:hypothetical protein
LTNKLDAGYVVITRNPDEVSRLTGDLGTTGERHRNHTQHTFTSTTAARLTLLPQQREDNDMENDKMLTAEEAAAEAGMSVDDWLDNTGVAVDIDMDDVEANATLLMYAFAESAGDDARTDAVAAQWLDRIGPDNFGYTAAAALSMMTRHILAPVLDVAERRGVDLRAGIRDAYANALATI